MHTLKISMASDSVVRIEAIGEISENVWDSVLDWWSIGQKLGVNSRCFDVALPDFSQRKLWLRENWKSLGHELLIDDQVKIALRRVDALITEFIKISDRDFDGVDEINLDSIRLNVALTDFQKKNIIRLIGMPNGANFSVPGAGKTLTTLALWEYFRVRGDIARMLIVCPRSAFEAWKGDSKLLLRNPLISLFTEEPIDSEIEILYVNYEQLENADRLARLVRWISGSTTMLVIDEAHRVKGGGASIRWRACRDLANHASRIDLLTGTPMPQSQEDLRNLLALSWRSIPREFFSESRLSSLRRGGVFVRTTKKELQLPPMKITSVELPMCKIQKEVYAALRQSFVGQFDISNADNSYFSRRGKAVMTLIAAATNPGLLMRTVKEDAYLGLSWPPKVLTGKERLMSVLEEYATYEIPEKYQWIARFVAKATKEGKKVLIWSTFIANILALKRLLAPYDPAVIYGASSQEDRDSELRKFRTSNTCSVLLSNPQTLGEGISLHKECHDAIYVDRSYNGGLYLQSLDRIHRLGLPKEQETNIFILQSEGSIDQRIARRLADKIQRLGFYLDDQGLAEVSLPGLDDEVFSDSMSGLDDIDLSDIYQHLIGND